METISEKVYSIIQYTKLPVAFSEAYLKTGTTKCKSVKVSDTELQQTLW
jgi:hypothetical protein